MERFITILFTCFLFSLPVLAAEPAIVMAAKSSDLAKIEAALAAGEDVNVLGNGGASALMWASKNNHIESVDFLLANGADVNAKDKAGYTALIYTGNAAIAADLIEHKADVNVRTKNQNTALMMAVRNGRLDIVKLLLDKGANVSAKGASGCTALMFSAQQDDEIGAAIAELLIKHGADVNAANEEGHTSLMSAAEMGHLSTVRLLLNNGADKNLKDSDESTALDYAVEEEHAEIIELLK